MLQVQICRLLRSIAFFDRSRFIRFSPFVSGPNKAYIRTGIVLKRKMRECSPLKQESPSKAREITSKA
jgi:hypothetical protein